ncbi:MAG: type IV pilin protein [Elusimicrobiota bacterium]
MIVVAIIGVLAAIAIPKFASLISKSQEGAAKGGLGSLRSALSIYYGDMEGQYPGNITVGLTSGVSLLPALPSITLPSPAGHVANNVEGQAGLGSLCPPNMADLADTQVWYYDPPQSNTACAGSVFIHCTHLDSKGSLWSNY